MKAPGLLARLRNLLRDSRGVAVIELALAAPVFLIMVAGVADLSSAYSRKLALEQAAQRSIEKIMQTSAETTPDQVLLAEAIAQAGGGLTADDVAIRYSLYCFGNDGGSRQLDYNAECDEGQSSAHYLEVQVSDEYDPILPIHFGPTTADGKMPVNATAGMRIE